MFEAFYASVWQHPIALWGAAALGLGIALSQPFLHRSVRITAIVIALVSAVDAWLTTNEVPGLGALSASVATFIGVFFVIVGDFRYFAIREWLDERDGSIRPSVRGVSIALGLSFIVPIWTIGISELLGDPIPRVIFLIHEASFFGLVAIRRIVPTRTSSEWQKRLDWSALSWYGTWVIADVIILAFNADVGYLLRVVPNLLYYGSLPAFLACTRPTRVRVPTRPVDRS